MTLARSPRAMQSRQRRGVRRPSGAVAQGESCQPASNWIFRRATQFFWLHRPALRWHFRHMPEPRVPWPHAPTHLFTERGSYFVTSATYQKAHFFRGATRLRVLHRGLLKVAEQFGWQLEAGLFSRIIIILSPTRRRRQPMLPVCVRCWACCMSKLPVGSISWKASRDGRCGSIFGTPT